jgi:hypothetical protein
MDGERLVWQGGLLYRLDAVGSLAWECFDGQTTVSSLGQMLGEAFGVSESDVQQDLLTLCSELLDQGLLEGGRPRTVEPASAVRIGRLPGVPLADEDLPYVTRRFRAFDHDFAIRTDDRRLATYFDRSLRSFSVEGAPARWYSVVSGAEGRAPYRTYLDGEGLFAVADAEATARYLLWHINYQVVRGSSPHLLIHAAGATIGGKAVVFPGEMNAGKTTLVAGLVLEGLGFLTDELVALNLTTDLVDPYPRPLNVGRGSWDVLSVLRPPDRDERDPIPRLLWHVDPSSIRPDAVAGSAPIGWVIAPRFDPGRPTQLGPLSRPEAVEMLYRHAFNKHRFGNDGIRALVDAVSRARCGRLTSGDLVSAVAAVRHFVERDGRPESV